ncbi:hypothetical protein [Streptomyces sp. WAC06614]|uniref:hypothetical protein n=1 Tax=Streptomyces sp. WAC06614 TaxID=2487416 RepID=UPI000F78F403|nr:hypothetical protein [Streptomyces sp. WAC06614]RSS81535.1 hypothetical protein EF918_10070 [Streptomyces sp. WAC06614]
MDSAYWHAAGTLALLLALAVLVGYVVRYRRTPRRERRTLRFSWSWPVACAALAGCGLGACATGGGVLLGTDPFRAVGTTLVAALAAAALLRARGADRAHRLVPPALALVLATALTGALATP